MDEREKRAALQHQLAIEYQRTRDPAVLTEIIETLRKLINGMIRRRFSPEDYEEAFHVAEIAVMLAAEKFDPKMDGGSLSGYARFHIQNELNAFLSSKSSSMGGMTGRAAKWWKARGRKRYVELLRTYPHDLALEIVAQEAPDVLNVTTDKLEKMMAALNPAEPLTRTSDDGGEYEYIEDENGHGYDGTPRLMKILDMADLDAREMTILCAVFSEAEPKLDDIGKKMGMSGERVRQIRNEAIEKLRISLSKKGMLFDDLLDKSG